jgi:hypothetical protein
MVEASGGQKGWSTRRSLHKSERSCQDPRVWSGCSPEAHATWIRRVGRRTQLHYRPCPVVEKSCGSCTTVTQVSAVTTLMFFP